MRRKFRNHKKIKFSKIFKILILIIIIYYLYKFINMKFNFKINDTFIKFLLNDKNYISDKIINTKNVINNPAKLLATNFYYNKNDKVKVVSNDVKLDNKPLVYIYNSHQSENYSMEYMEDYNVNPTVLMASYMIKERLDNLGIYTIVEEENISQYLDEHGMKYSQSYEASRHYLIKAMEENNSIKLYLDVHRDAISHDYSTINIDNKDCAKIMFVVGKEHENYLKNLESANKMNNMIKEKYPTITRGVLEKEGKNVNGIYNQDLGPNVMLIEIGGNYNNINEVLNTIDLITPIIGEYVNEKR